MKDFYENTRAVMDRYNIIMDNIVHSEEETSKSDDEFLDNFCIYLAHSLIKDTGDG